MLLSASAVLLCAAALLLLCGCSLPPGALAQDVPFSVSWLSNGNASTFLPRAVYSPACDSSYQWGLRTASAAYWGGNSLQFTPSSWTRSSYGAPSGRPLPSWLNFSLQDAQLPTGLASFGLFQSQLTVVAWAGTTPTGDSGLPVANNSVYLSTNGGASWAAVKQHTPFAPRYNFTYCPVVTNNTSSIKIGFMYGGYGAGGTLLGECWTLNISGQASKTCDHDSSGVPVRASPGLTSLLNSGSGSYIILTGGRSGNERNTSYSYHNDIWTSIDLGVTWLQITDAAPWTPRYGLSIWSGQQQDFFIYGGNGAGVGSAEVPLNDLWWGSDLGTGWFQLQPSNAAFAPVASIAGCFMSTIFATPTGSTGAVLYFYHLANTAGLGAPAGNYSAILQVSYNSPPS